MHGFGDELHKRIEDKLKVVAGDVGLELKWSETHTRSVTQNVVEDLQGCDALVQVATRRATERTANVAVEWLIAEYFAAAALDLVRVRVIDTGNAGLKRDEWRRHLLIMDQDTQPYEFDSVALQSLTDAFRKAIVAIADELRRRRDKLRP